MAAQQRHTLADNRRGWQSLRVLDLSDTWLFKAQDEAAVLLLGGCVTATPIMTPSGQQGFSLNCSAMNDIGQCYKKAGELCGGNGYEIYDQNNKPVTFWSGANQTMVVRCKVPSENRAG